LLKAAPSPWRHPINTLKNIDQLEGIRNGISKSSTIVVHWCKQRKRYILTVMFEVNEPISNWSARWKIIRNFNAKHGILLDLLLQDVVHTCSKRLGPRSEKLTLANSNVFPETCHIRLTPTGH
jgi:hypothetical protein